MYAMKMFIFHLAFQALSLWKYLGIHFESIITAVLFPLVLTMVREHLIYDTFVLYFL